MRQADEELYSLLVPLNQNRLIVPRSCVVEVIRYSAPAPIPDSAPWLLGNVSWSGKPVPVVSFEHLAGLTPAVPGGRTRIAILNSITGRLESGHFGLLTEGFPQLVRVNRNVIEPDARTEWPEGGPVLCQIRMINEYPLIPDLEAVEDMIEVARHGLDEPLI